jgi:hypothetical protein
MVAQDRSVTAVALGVRQEQDAVTRRCAVPLVEIVGGKVGHKPVLPECRNHLSVVCK